MRAVEPAERREEEPGNQQHRSIDDDIRRAGASGAGPTQPQTTPAVLDRIARELPDHDALITRREDTDLRRAARRGAPGRRGDDRPRCGPRRPGGDLVAEHLALGGRLPGRALRGRRCRPVEHPIHRQRGRRHPGPHRGATADRDGRVPGGPTGSPIWTAINCPRCGTSCGCRSIRQDGTWDEFVARGSNPALAAADARAAAVAPDDVSDILFTSGTTGRSKGVLCAHRQSLSAPAAWAACGEVTSADRYLCINPFFHNFGYKAGILACLQTGATLIPMLTFDPEAAMRAVQEHRRHRAPGAADDLPDTAGPPEARRLRPDVAAVRGHRRGGGAGGAHRADAVRTRHRHRADGLRAHGGKRFRDDVPRRRRRRHRRHHLRATHRRFRIADRR